MKKRLSSIILITTILAIITLLLTIALLVTDIWLNWPGDNLWEVLGNKFVNLFYLFDFNRVVGGFDSLEAMVLHIGILTFIGLNVVAMVMWFLFSLKKKGHPFGLVGGFLCLFSTAIGSLILVGLFDDLKVSIHEGNYSSIATLAAFGVLYMLLAFLFVKSFKWYLTGKTEKTIVESTVLPTITIDNVYQRSGDTWVLKTTTQHEEETE